MEFLSQDFSIPRSMKEVIIVYFLTSINMKRIPLQFILSAYTGKSPQEMSKWGEKEWLKLAEQLRKEGDKPFIKPKGEEC